MGATTRRDLYLQIGGSAAGLQAAAKVGKSAVIDIATGAEYSAERIQKAFADMADGPIEASAKAMEARFNRTFSAIQANARKVMEAPTPAAASQILNVAGADRAARAAELEAAAMRKIADGASAIAARSELATAEQRHLAVGFEVSALQAEKNAAALRATATAYREIADEAGIVAVEDEEAMGRVSKGTGQAMIAKAEFMHVLRAASDSYAAGIPVTQIFAMEIGRLGEAAAFYGQSLAGAKGKGEAFREGLTEVGEGAAATGVAVAGAERDVGKMGARLAAVGEFMGGPWGLAATMALAVLAPLVAKTIEGGDALEDETKKLKENAEKTEIAEQAKRIFARTEAGMIATTKELTRELDKQNESLRTNAERQNIKARENLGQLKLERPKYVQAISDAERDLRITQSTAGGNEAGVEAVATDKAAVQAARDALAAFDKNVAEASVAYERSKVPLAAEQAKRDQDPEARINKLFDSKSRNDRAEADKAAREGRQVGAATLARLAAIEVDRKAALKAEQERKQAETRTKTDNEQSGRQISLADAEGIIRGIGGRITSEQRSTALQKVLYDRYQAYKAGTGPWAPLAAKPGTSAHERGEAVDIAKGGGMTLAKIVEAFRAQGVKLTEKLDEGDHFHVAWAHKGGRGPSAETLEHREQAAADKAERDREAFAQLRARAEEDGLRLQRQQLLSYGDAAELDRRQIDVERDRLKAAYDRNAALKKEAIDREERSHQLEVMFTADEHARSARDALIQIDLDMATTRGERLALEQQLLADSQAERRARLQRIAQDPKTSDDDFAQAESDLAELPAQDARERGALSRRYQSPMAAYRDQLKGDVGDMGDALQSVEVTGIKGMEDGLQGILSGTKSVKDGFREMATSVIADLERIALEKLILSFLGFKDGGKISAGGGLIPGFAGGGDPSVSNGVIRGAGTGTSDSILAMVGRRPIRVANGEAIVNARGVRKHWPLIDAINHDALPGFAAGGMVDPASIYLRALPSAASLARPTRTEYVYVTIDKSQLFDAHVQRAAAPLAQAAMIGGAAQARQESADDAYSRIPV